MLLLLYGVMRGQADSRGRFARFASETGNSCVLRGVDLAARNNLARDSGSDGGGFQQSSFLWHGFLLDRETHNTAFAEPAIVGIHRADIEPVSRACSRARARG